MIKAAKEMLLKVLNRYRIEMLAVVSKDIRETEKNLRQVFDAVEGDGLGEQIAPAVNRGLGGWS